jgi:hypothetical protein
MIYATLVKINRIVKDAPITNALDQLEKGAFAAQAIDKEWEFTAIKTLKYNKVYSALKSYKSFVCNEKVKSSDNEYGMMIHKTPFIKQSREVQLVYTEDTSGSVIQENIANPLWNKIDGVKRNISRSGEIELQGSMALQSQLFAMLDSTSSDQKWMDRFRLKDHQQNTIYQWQDEVFNRSNDMSPIEMQRLATRVCRHARIPNVPIRFKEKGNACMFAISHSGGSSSHEGDKKDDKPDWSWLNTAEEDTFQTLGELNVSPRIKISSMHLEMVMSWAMNNVILLHELAHYIHFLMPTPYRLNRGPYRLTFDEYEEIFAGHGSSYMAIFVRLLIDFGMYKEDALYESLDEAGIWWFPIEKLTVDSFTRGITKYCKKYE